MSTIPASYSVQVTPSVIGAQGAALALNGLVLDNSNRVPLGQVLSFPTAAAVASYFGASSKQAVVAGGGTTLAGNPAGKGYFGGFDLSSEKPGALLFANYNTAAVSAWLRGGNAGAALTLAQLQALNAAMSVTVDAVVKSGTVNLAAATSFSNAAQIIADTLDIEGVQSSTFTGSITGTTLTVPGAVTGIPLAVGQFVDGAGVNPTTYITAVLTSTTFTVSVSQTVGSISMTAHIPGVVYDSISGGFQVNSATTGPTSTIGYASGALADSLLLTAATGAVTSQGAAAAVPATFMNALTAINQNWASFFMDFDPDNGSGITQKLAFAAWTNTQAPRYAYVAWDTDLTPGTTLPASASLGYQVNVALKYAGTIALYEPVDYNHAAFVSGSIASIDFDEAGGRTSFAYLTQSGMQAAVTDETIAYNLGGNPLVSGSFGNYYNFVGAFGTANQGFVNLQRGLISGDYRWIDSYVNQIAMTNDLQLTAYSYMTQVKSFPYTNAGYANFQTALQSTIQKYLDFGAFSGGVPLSSDQIAEVNQLAGAKIADTLMTQGWYLQVKPANSTVRQSRGSPPITFYYVDAGSVQALNIGSVAVQ